MNVDSTVANGGVVVFSIIILIDFKLYLSLRWLHHPTGSYNYTLTLYCAGVIHVGAVYGLS